MSETPTRAVAHDRQTDSPSSHLLFGGELKEYDGVAVAARNPDFQVVEVAEADRGNVEVSRLVQALPPPAHVHSHIPKCPRESR